MSTTMQDQTLSIQKVNIHILEELEVAEQAMVYLELADIEM
jgi:hypothetical protein